MRKSPIFAALLALFIVFTPVPAGAEDEFPIEQITCFPQDGMLYCINHTTGEFYTIPDPDYVPPGPGGGF